MIVVCDNNHYDDDDHIVDADRNADDSAHLNADTDMDNDRLKTGQDNHSCAKKMFSKNLVKT